MAPCGLTLHACAVPVALQMYDSDGSGELDQDEFIQVLKATGERTRAVASKKMKTETGWLACQSSCSKQTWQPLKPAGCYAQTQQLEHRQCNPALVLCHGHRCAGFDQAEAEKMYHEVDADGGGSVSLQEFEDWFRATQRTQVRESCHGHLKH